MNTFSAPLFDAHFVACLSHYEAVRVQTFLVNDVLKASNGLFDQMWCQGTVEEARKRLAMVREHGQKYLGWVDEL